MRISHLKYADDGQLRNALGWAEAWVMAAPGLARQVIDQLMTTAELSAGLIARSRWLSILADGLERQPRALQSAFALIDEWLGPEKLGAINQYLGIAEIQLLLRRLEQTPTVRSLAARVSQRGEPELVFPDGDVL